MSDIIWTNVRVRLGDLKPWADNPRLSTKAQARRLLASFEKFGQVQTVAIDPECNVLDGHQRLSALLTIHGDKYELDARQASRALSDAERRELVVSLHAGAVGSWDWNAISGWNSEELQSWGMDGDLLKSWNNDANNLKELLKSEQPGADAEPQTDRAAELLEKWGCKSGDLWQIGEHRLICGDCTDAATVARVMGGERADMVFTDPPYNVASESRNYAADKSKAMKDLSEAEWDKDFDIKSLFPVLESIMAQDCAVYICTSQWLVQQIWEWMWKWSDFCSYCVWCKPNPMPSLSKRHWTWATELIPYAVRGKHVSNFPTDGHALNWWSIPKAKDTDHPTEKVLEVPARAIEFSSKAGAIVFDGFLGSGTTLVACENLGRRCRAIEISPAYCAVALERMSQAFPGIDTRRLDAGG
jgi:DNA modification methylase